MNVNNKLKNIEFKKQKRAYYHMVNDYSGNKCTFVKQNLEPNEKTYTSYYIKKYGKELIIIEVSKDNINRLCLVDIKNDQLIELVEFVNDKRYLSLRNSPYALPYNYRKVLRTEIDSEKSIIDTFPEHIKRDIILDKILKD